MEKQTKDLGREGPKDFLTFVNAISGWTSLSLHGRGTSVWLVLVNATGPVFAKRWYSQMCILTQIIDIYIVQRYKKL
jgi:hypothetical protein